MPHARALYGSALRLTRSPQDAEDLVQETLLRAFKGFAGYRPGSNARAWLYTILHRVRTDMLRKRGRSPQTTEMAEEGPAVAADHEAVLTAGNEDVQRALAEVPEVFRCGARAARRRGVQLRRGRRHPRDAGRHGDVAHPPRPRRAAAAARREAAVSCQPEKVTALVDGALASSQAALVEEHLAACPPCRALADAERAVHHRLHALPAHEPPFGLEARLRATPAGRSFALASPPAPVAAAGTARGGGAARWPCGRAACRRSSPGNSPTTTATATPTPSRRPSVRSAQPAVVAGWFAEQGTPMPSVPAQAGSTRLCRRALLLLPGPLRGTAPLLRRRPAPAVRVRTRARRALRRLVRNDARRAQRSRCCGWGNWSSASSARSRPTSTLPCGNCAPAPRRGRPSVRWPERGALRRAERPRVQTPARGL